MRRRPSSPGATARQYAMHPQHGQKWKPISLPPREYALVAPETRIEAFS
jgi:hypothetical protein